MLPEAKRVLLAVALFIMVIFFYLLNSNSRLEIWKNYYLQTNGNTIENTSPDSFILFFNKTILQQNKTRLKTPDAVSSSLQNKGSQIVPDEISLNETKNFTKTNKTTTTKNLLVNQTNNTSRHLKNTVTNYTINTSGCRIPYLDPWHPSIIHLVKSEGVLKCKAESLVKQNGSRLQIDQEVAKKMDIDVKDIDCYYDQIIRSGNNTNDNKFTAVPKNVHFKDETVITDEFVNVTCTVKNSTVYTDYFAFIIKKTKTEERCKNSKAGNKSETFRFIFLGMDSVSKSQFLRHMKKTHEFIQRNLDAIELHGYTKVGLNTFPNIIAMLANYTSDQLPNMSKKPANIIPLIWNDLAKEGYRILFAEDIPSISIFNYAKLGFHEQPTDYYMRPFSWAVERSSVIKNGKRGCWRGRLETSAILNWSLDFLNMFANEKAFSFTFLTRLSHDIFNEVSYQDEPYLQHLQQLKDNGHFNNSFVFFFGDHGFRFGSMRATYIGRMEDMLPFYFVIVPSWFKEKYPVHYKNLKTNEHRLTTAFDIFATIVDIKNFTGQTETKHFSSRGISLFSEIPETRTCENASIAIQYCSCIQELFVPLDDPIVINGAKKLVERINSITKPRRDKCAVLTYSNVTDASKEVITSGKTNSNSTLRLYRVSVEVEPSKGVFEGMVWCTEGNDNFTIEKNIDRINLYGNQSSCINESKLKPYCYCGS